MSGLQDLNDVLVELMKDTYDAESQLVEALPKMAAAASNSALKRAFKDHLAETKTHVSRLEEAFEHLGTPARKKKCKAMVGLVKEGEEACKEEGKPELVDAGIISAVQKVEHYEIAAYGTLRTYAELLELPKLAALFEETLEEEKASDAGLSEIAEGKLLTKVLAARK
jgi:ferritin-like metal-binding protein YciE